MITKETTKLSKDRILVILDDIVGDALPYLKASSKEKRLCKAVYIAKGLYFMLLQEVLDNQKAKKMFEWYHNAYSIKESEIEELIINCEYSNNNFHENLGLIFKSSSLERDMIICRVALHFDVEISDGGRSVKKIDRSVEPEDNLFLAMQKATFRPLNLEIVEMRSLFD